MAKGVSSDISRKFAVLRTLANSHHPTLAMITDQNDISEPTAKRHIASLRTDYGMVIKYVAEGNNANGYYMIVDWGWINWSKMKSHLNQLLSA